MKQSISEIEKFAQLVTGHNIARVGVFVALLDICPHFVPECDMIIPDTLQFRQQRDEIRLEAGLSLKDEIQQVNIARLARVQVLQYRAVAGHLLVRLYLPVQFLDRGVEEQKVIDGFIEKKVR
jgi:hypothetical protein